SAGRPRRDGRPATVCSVAWPAPAAPGRRDAPCPASASAALEARDATAHDLEAEPDAGRGPGLDRQRGGVSLVCHLRVDRALALGLPDDVALAVLHEVAEADDEVGGVDLLGAFVTVGRLHAARPRALVVGEVLRAEPPRPRQAEAAHEDRDVGEHVLALVLAAGDDEPDVPWRAHLRGRDREEGGQRRGAESEREGEGAPGARRPGRRHGVKIDPLCPRGMCPSAPMWGAGEHAPPVWPGAARAGGGDALRARTLAALVRPSTRPARPLAGSVPHRFRRSRPLTGP